MGEKIEILFKSLSAGALIGYTFGGWTVLLTLLLILVVADWLSGWAAAWMNGELKSRVGYYGIARKVGIFVMVMIAHLIDVVLGNAHYFRDIVIFFYLANELLSVVENLGRMGLPIPNVILSAVKIFETKSEQGKEDQKQTNKEMN